VTGSPLVRGRAYALPGSPLGQLWAKVDADLAAGTIPALCPHPPDHLVYPSGFYGCAICVRVAQALVDQQAPRVCACCGGPATRDSIRVIGELFAWIRACDDCAGAGSVTVHPN
jgi:hypothetical protein